MDIKPAPDSQPPIGRWHRLLAFLGHAMDRLLSRNRCARCENTRFFF